ncbi:hypothetical protein FIBSPDRAFT_896693 [Athelia psychrophila]|uniref:DUF6533 domain-containing protein n=1 Tax=Athelia psychrophila TaxID=1759441 RepID=A0A166D4V3_9AGAM|nr:hypothetical protein FIBSPDRAFT_896693 [Fibularhizoctonia sp. CBS 109695]
MIALPYIAIANLTAYSYDWLLSISGEYQIIARAGITWPIAIYLLSRITTAAHLLMIVLMISFMAMFAATKVISTSFLFFLRVRAVYLRSRYVTVLFGILWLITAILNIITDASIRAEPHTDAQHCMGFRINHSSYPSISSFVFDTFVFIAISYRLAANAATEQSWRARLQSVVTGNGLFNLSRAFMMSGQLYYLAIIVFFWVNLAVMGSPLIPTGSHNVLNMPYMAFTNIMACGAFRGVALGMLESSHTTRGLSSTRIAAAFELAAFPEVPSVQDAKSNIRREII